MLKAEKEECVNFRLGFCSFGSMCKFRHVKLSSEQLPPVSELFLKSYIGDERVRTREMTNSSTWRVKECPEFSGPTGWCPFFDQCNFAHGETELRHWRPKVRARSLAAMSPYLSNHFSSLWCVCRVWGKRGLETTLGGGMGMGRRSTAISHLPCPAPPNNNNMPAPLPVLREARLRMIWRASSSATTRALPPHSISQAVTGPLCISCCAL
jgi:hypothetical protein